MKGKLLFVAGLAAGYVIGAKAGRPAYDALVGRVERAASDPHVHDVVQKAKAAAEEAAPAVAGAVTAAAGAVGGAASAAKDAGAPPATEAAAPPAPTAPDTGAVQGGADESRTPTASD